MLERILAHKREELTAARRVRPAQALSRAAEAHPEPVRGFARALRGAPQPRIVAEVKRRSPSRGEIRTTFDPVECATAYERGGAAAISVLTDERFFGGHLSYLAKLRASVALPLLRKDFLIDPYQVDEARLAGADAVLLIVAALPQAELAALHARARELSLDALVEVHDEHELERALELGAEVIGINNRDLATFETDLAVSERLLPRLPKQVVAVSESGIFNHEDVRRLARAGASAFLVGESLMRQDDMEKALRALRSDS